MRWTFSLLLFFCAGSPGLAQKAEVPHQVFEKSRLVLEPFQYYTVKLRDSRLKQQFDQVVKEYLSIPNEDLLKGFRERAGLPTKSAKNMGGWYSNDVFHVFGQLLSGMSRLHAVSGNLELKDKVGTLINEWAMTIDSTGYFFYSNKPNAPHYVYEKMVGGLVDAYIFTGNKEALFHLSVITDWAIQNLGRERLYGQTKSEWYTLSENLYRAYQATGNQKYLDFGKVWEYHEYWNSFINNKGVNPKVHHHAYSHLNTLSGAAAAYLVSGEEKYKSIIRNGYDYFQQEQCFATGGFGPNERFLTKEGLANILQNSHNSFETQCGSWAIFKLSKYLLQITGDARYGDWIEKMTINGIGASLPMTADGRVQYYSDYHARQGTKHVYFQGWSCCTGTRPQAVAEYADLVYFKSNKGLFVNLYVPSSVEWNNLVVQQQTQFPETNETVFSIGVKSKAGARRTLHFRKPSWSKVAPAVFVNGKEIKWTVANNWVAVERTWQDGDQLKLVFPMNLYIERLDKAKPFPAAVMYGPVAMAVNVTDDYPTSYAAEDKLSGQFRLVAGKPLTFQVKNYPGLILRPYYQFNENEPYTLYVDPAAKDIIPEKSWVWTGQWERKKGPYFTNELHASISAVFDGTGIEVLLAGYRNSGVILVEIDGKEVEKLNTYSSKEPEKQIQKLYENLPAGKHTIKLSVTGEKDPQSKGVYLNVLRLMAIPYVGQ